MEIDDIRIVNEPLVLSTPAEVDALETKLWITFPEGYRDFMTRLGEGVLAASLIRIYPPWRIERELSEWRRRIHRYWFWDEGRELLPKERALECVIIGDTLNGDELVFHPTRPGRLFVLPRDSEKIFEAGGDLLSAIEWVCTSGELAEPFDERDFEPFDSRPDAEHSGKDGAIFDPDGESLHEIVELATNWAKRHKVKQAARKELRSRTDKETKAELIYEGILIDARAKSDVGYGVGWRILDEGTGKLVGLFHWHHGEGVSGSEYEPIKNR